MARSYSMTWVSEQRRWLKKYRGKLYGVSCRQLGTDDTKDASWQAANEWWQKKQTELLTEATHGVDASHALRAMTLLQQWEQLPPEARQKFLAEALSPEQLAAVEGQAAALAEKMTGPIATERTIGAQLDAWGKLLQAEVANGKISPSRYDAYLRNVGIFADWIGRQVDVDAIDASRLEKFYAELSLKVAKKKISPSYAHSVLGATKQFIRRLAELDLMPLPRNITSRRLSFGGTVGKKVETYTQAEVRLLLAACPTDRTQLFVLLGLNCGMYQADVADLGIDEVDWKAGRITRARSKTEGAQEVTYKLWPETFALLKAQRSKHECKNDRGSNRVLTTEGGTAITLEWVEDGKMRKYDGVAAAYLKIDVPFRKPFKVLRKTSASLLAEHPQYKFYHDYFLAHSPRTVSEKSYVRPSDQEFAAALDWLRLELLGAPGSRQ
jgi:integrase